MSIEIERKFLVRGDAWRSLTIRHKHMRQGYLGREGGFSTRVRIVDKSQATLTIKSRKAGLRRLEFEYPIPLADAELLLSLRSGAIVEKVRHVVPWQGLEWEVDLFEGANVGLIIAEIELDSETQSFARPAWVGAEITGQARYYNGNLAQQPFSAWSSQAQIDTLGA
jgi:adenylate cyclase